MKSECKDMKKKWENQFFWQFILFHMYKNQKGTGQRSSITSLWISFENHDKYSSTLLFILEKKNVKNINFLAFPPSLFAGWFVICGF